MTHFYHNVLPTFYIQIESNQLYYTVEYYFSCDGKTVLNDNKINQIVTDYILLLLTAAYTQRGGTECGKKHANLPITSNVLLWCETPCLTIPFTIHQSRNRKTHQQTNDETGVIENSD